MRCLEKNRRSVRAGDASVTPWSQAACKNDVWRPNMQKMQKNWTLPGLNRRPPACKAGALPLRQKPNMEPTELMQD